MIKFKRFLFDLSRPRYWSFIALIRDIVWRVKDYDRMAYDYSCVLDHATGSAMSKTNYEVSQIYSVIDDRQREHYYQVVKDDVGEIIKEGGTIEYVKEYIDKL